MMLLVLSSEKCIDIRFFLKKFLFFTLLGLYCCSGFAAASLPLVVSGGCCLAVVHKFLTAAAPLVAELSSRV